MYIPAHDKVWKVFFTPPKKWYENILEIIYATSDSFKDLEPYFQNEPMWLEGEHKNVQMCMNVHKVQIAPNL